MGLNRLNDGTDSWRTPLQDEELSGNDPRLIPGFSFRCSGMFPEWFRIVSVPAGAAEIRLG